jgi:hypothetical protein
MCMEKTKTKTTDDGLEIVQYCPMPTDDTPCVPIYPIIHARNWIIVMIASESESMLEILSLAP